VSVARPVRREVLDHVVFTGNVEAVHEIEIKARVSGFVTAVHFIDGQAVSEGDLLFTIDVRPYEIARDTATAEVAKQQALLAEQTSEVTRKEKLLPKGAVTREEYEITVAKRDATAAMLAAAKARLAQAELDLSFCTVASPVTGRVSRRLVDVGDLVAGTDGTATTLTAVASTDPVYVVFEAEERSVILAREQAAEERAANSPGQPVEWRNIKDLEIPVDVQLLTDDGFPRRGVLDFVDIAAIVLSLLALLFSYDALTKEKEDGTLRQQMANPLPRSTLLAGKLAGILMTLLPVLVFCFLVGGLIVLLARDLAFSGREWGRLGLLAVVSLAYLVVFVLVGMLVSARPRELFLFGRHPLPQPPVHVPDDTRQVIP